MVGTMVDIIVKKIDENMINNMPGGYILDKMNNQNGTSFRHDNVIFVSDDMTMSSSCLTTWQCHLETWRWHCHVESSSHFDCSFYLKYNHLACYWSYFHPFFWNIITCLSSLQVGSQKNKSERRGKNIKGKPPGKKSSQKKSASDAKRDHGDKKIDVGRAKKDRNELTLAFNVDFFFSGK